MNQNKRYLHDKFILLLLTISFFLVALGSLLILLRLNNTGGADYIIQYRSNLGLSAFQSGGVATFFEFIAYMIAILIINIIISVRLYAMRRIYSVIVLSIGVLLLVLSIIVSNALLVLR
jgi:hypothetical protein